jgi:phosphatidylglycerophosphate synthase
MVNKLPSEIDNYIDGILYKFIDSHIQIYKKLGFTPNTLTTFALITGYITAYLITQKKFYLAGFTFFLSYYFDCADGKFARKYNMVTIFGDYYDHFSDVTKVCLILFALYKTNAIKFKKIIIIIILLFILAMYHMGCQQCLYKSEVTESPTLDIFKSTEESCIKNVNYTKYFGFGTFNFVLLLIIVFWNKIY